MKFMRPVSRLSSIGILIPALLISVALPLLYAPSVEAQSIWERLFSRRRSAEGQASGRASGGAVRDALCSAESPGQSLRAIVPASNQGDTVEAHPTFFFYVPFSSTQNEELVAEFMLLTEDRYYLLEEPLLVSLPETPGIVRLGLPEDMPGLEIGKRYNWYFSLLCEDWELSRNPFISGWVERVSPDEVDDTWHELLSSLTQQLPTGQMEWASFLSFYNLEEFARQPVEELTPISR